MRERWERSKGAGGPRWEKWTEAVGQSALAGGSGGRGVHSVGGRGGRRVHSSARWERRMERRVHSSASALASRLCSYWVPCVLAFWHFGVLRLLVALRFVRSGVLRPTAGVQAAFCAFCAFWTWGHS